MSPARRARVVCLGLIAGLRARGEVGLGKELRFFAWLARFVRAALLGLVVEVGRGLEGLQFAQLIHQLRRQALASGADALHQGEVLDLEGGQLQLASLLLTPVLEDRIVGVGEQEQLIARVLADDLLALGFELDAEALDVLQALLGVVVDGRPDLLRAVLLDTQ